eukprot:12787870-Ditylum_brightwellii.AAC.1
MAPLWEVIVNIYFVIKFKGPKFSCNVLRSTEHGMDEYGTTPEHDSFDGLLSNTILIMAPNTVVTDLLRLQITIFNK